MKNEKTTFALYFGNRGFFPSASIVQARAEIEKAVENAGYDFITLKEDKTKFGAVETIDEGKIYADFLKENEGKYQGIIVSLPNFGDENGLQAALRNVKVPILVQAFPDEIGKMDFEHRRDAMCGKFAICNLLRQMGIPFSLTKKFTVSPSSEEFRNDLEKFASICRIVKGMKNFNVGAIGARTTAFKTVRVDEYALQKYGINMEAIDLSTFFEKAEAVNAKDVENAVRDIEEIAEFNNFPREKITSMAKAYVAFKEIIKEYDLQAIAVRCWSEFQSVMGIAPCTSLCLLNEVGISAACEVDVTNAIMMRALSLASDSPCALLDFNNNYSDEEDKAILFHCGPVPISMLRGKGEIIEHLMFKKCYGEGTGVGVNKGEIRSGAITFGSLKTENGKISAFVSDGSFTDDAIEKSFFGTGKVIQKEKINSVENYMAESGYKHHICVTFGDYKDAITEAFEKYLKIETQTF